jgi:hypothetical protein
MVSRALPSCTSNRFLADLGPVSRTLFASPDGRRTALARTISWPGVAATRQVGRRAQHARVARRLRRAPHRVSRDACGVECTCRMLRGAGGSPPVCTAHTGGERLRHVSLETAHIACSAPTPRRVLDGVRSACSLVQTTTSETAPGREPACLPRRIIVMICVRRRRGTSSGLRVIMRADRVQNPICATRHWSPRRRRSRSPMRYAPAGHRVHDAHHEQRLRRPWRLPRAVNHDASRCAVSCRSNVSRRAAPSDPRIVNRPASRAGPRDADPVPRSVPPPCRTPGRSTPPRCA